MSCASIRLDKSCRLDSLVKMGRRFSLLASSEFFLWRVGSTHDVRPVFLVKFPARLLCISLLKWQVGLNIFVLVVVLHTYYIYVV